MQNSAEPVKFCLALGLLLEDYYPHLLTTKWSGVSRKGLMLLFEGNLYDPSEHLDIEEPMLIYVQHNYKPN